MSATQLRHYEPPTSEALEVKMRGLLCMSELEGETSGDDYELQEEVIW